MSEKQPSRVVVFGAPGQLGQQVVSRLEGLPWTGLEVVGVVSAESVAIEFECRGELEDAMTSIPALRAGDLVFVCTPGAFALEVVRAALRAEVPCIDCTGVMAQQAEVPMPVRLTELSDDEEKSLSQAPLLALPSATTLAWIPLLDGLAGIAPVRRLVATVLRSAAALGRRGLVALSDESIALFNQSESPVEGPAGQTVAFDVIPDREDPSGTAAELDRLFGPEFRVDVMTTQVPAFVGEGASLAIELATPLDEAAFMKRIEEIPGLSVVEGGIGTRGLEVVEGGIGTRGLEVVEAGRREPMGPTLRDAAEADQTLAGAIRSDASLPAGIGWRLWLSYDPISIAADHAIRLAALRFPGS